ncbi:MAG TPA: L,D-transpeptidase [Solirubrobacteraceae bacterium]|nr:L,D-transpeptidase [Solirubrobacteraceae bacterium]
MRGRRLRLLLALPLAFALAGLGATAHEAASRRPPSDAPRCKSGPARLGSSTLTVAAAVRSHAVAYRRPGARPFARFGRLNVNRFPTVFRVLAALRAGDCRARWYRVQLPIKPNGVTGYVRAAAVSTGRVRSRVLVDLSARRLTLFRSGRPVLRTKVAVGSPATPTPTGRYYVNQRLIPADPSGPFGPGAIGISAYSTVLTGWVQGGPIAIHGTNEPWSIGRAVSNGCIRVHNDVLRRIFRVTPAGTPVLIRR